HKPTGFTVAGAVDDIWVNPKGELIVVDYKSTSKDAKIESLDEAWHDGYKRQMEIYQWLLRERGFAVSDTGYWVYANASKDRKAFDGKLEFEVTLVPHKGATDWVEDTLKALKACGDSDAIPAAGNDCDYCRYREAAGKALQGASPKLPKPKNPMTGPTLAKADEKAKEKVQTGLF
ncbi:MAG: PD-(D/E)XK nuclease family protein, partial [Patescibacteria group bacterium]